MKLYQLVNAEPTLRKISAQNLPVKVLYSVYCVIRKLNENLEFYYTERNEICRKYAEEKDGKFVPKPEHKEEFEKQMLELLNLEVEAGDIKPVRIPADDKLRLSCDDLAAIEEFIIIKFEEET